MHFNRIKIILYLFGFFTFFSCIETSSDAKDNFDRKESLSFIADNIIIPSWENYTDDLEILQVAKNDFFSNPSTNTLNSFRDAFKGAWLSWQEVSMFEIGQGEKISIRNYTNIYPTDNDRIIQNIETQAYNLVLPSTYDEQGFPALDFLLYGLHDSDMEIIETLSQTNYTNYVSELVEKLNELANSVLSDWRAGFRNEFIENDGSSGTASYDLIVNDFIFYYEKFLRAGKVGIPAGVFSINPLPENVESFYSKGFSKELFINALASVERFYLGNSYDGNTKGNSLFQYLEYISELNNLENINESVIANWDGVRSLSTSIENDFVTQIENDNVKMLELFDQLQKNVVLLKVDMLQQLNIQVDYVDADGD